MSKYLYAYFATAAVMIVIDLIWLGLIAKPLYVQGMGHLMAEEPNLVAGALFYLMFPIGLVVFAIAPYEAKAGLRDALLAGGMFGFFAYATYDLTNLATLKNWPLGVALMDMAWGTLVSAGAAAAGKATLDWMAVP